MNGNSVSFFSFLAFSLGGFNVVDIVIIILCAIYALEGYAVGFVVAFFDLISFVFSFLCGLKFYSVISGFLFSQFAIPEGFARAIGFFVIAFVAEIVFSFILRRIISNIRPEKPLRIINHFFGIFPGFLSALVLLSFLLTSVTVLPLSSYIKHIVSESKLGGKLVIGSAIAEKQLNAVFGGAIKDTLTFMTVEPKSDESLALHFTVSQPVPDSEAEMRMFAMVNQERTSRGISALVFDQSLRDVARAHAVDMFKRGYFSHYTPEGQSPFDRMAAANITYTYAGENLALAPNVVLAMQGLMQSPGHKANILDPHFGRIGVGVVDGGIYGQMFDQEFTN